MLKLGENAAGDELYGAAGPGWLHVTIEDDGQYHVVTLCQVADLRALAALVALALGEEAPQR